MSSAQRINDFVEAYRHNVGTPPTFIVVDLDAVYQLCLATPELIGIKNKMQAIYFGAELIPCPEQTCLTMPASNS